MPTFGAGVKERGGLVSRSGLPFLIICLITSTFIASGFRDGELRFVTPLFDHLKLFLMLETYCGCLLRCQREVVAAQLAYQSVFLLRGLNEQHFEA